MSLREWVPRWWAGEGGAAGVVLGAALLPFEGMYRGVTAARNAMYDRGLRTVERVPVPVVSIGNLAVGGAGKTPFSAWVAGRLLGRGRWPAVVMRGYGGDEVLLHRELNPGVPVFAAARRVEAAREAVAAGCDVVVLDDAFQHRALARDLDVVLVAAEGWRARRRVLPRGPWREDVAALGRADLAVVTRKSASPERSAQVADELRRLAPELPLVEVSLSPSALRPLHGGDVSANDGVSQAQAGERSAEGLGWLHGRKVLAVAALADPRPFFAHLREHGAEVEEAPYMDHHAFSEDEARGLARRAAGRALVMTHKDAVKLRPLLGSEVQAWVLEQRVEVVSGGEALDAALERVLGGSPHPAA